MLGKLVRDFFWGYFNNNKKLKTIAWKKNLQTREADGLGIASIHDSVAAAQLRQVWNLASKRKSLWVEWAQAKYIKNKSFWTMQIPSNCSWGWRGILQS